GPESTGKSELTRALAAHYHTFPVMEFARQYLDTNGAGYTQNDLLKIAAGQLAAEEETIALCKTYNKPFLFADTHLRVIHIWSEIAFGACDNKILTQIARREYHLYLVCDTDLPWHPDPYREYPDPNDRKRIFHHYRAGLMFQEVPFTIISGTGEQRINSAISIVDRFLATEN